MARYKQPYSLYKRGKYWYYRTYTVDGLRTTGKSTGQTSKKLAAEYCDKLHLAGFLWFDEITFGEYAAHFYDDDSIYIKDRIEPLSKNTIRNYQKNFKNHIMPYFEKMQLNGIDYMVLKNFRAKLISENRSALSIQSIMSTLKHIFDTAYRTRKIQYNPFDFLEKISFKQSERDAFRLEEVCFIYNNISEEFKNAILFMALTGARISECVGAQYNKIIKQNDFEYIDLKVQYNNKELKQLKGKRARPVPIIPEIKELIGFEPMRLSAFYREFEPLKNQCENYEERLLCFHSLRHFFITNSKSCNVNDVKVEFIAGHSLKGEKKVYTNFKAEDLTDILPWQKETYLKIKNSVLSDR